MQVHFLKHTQIDKQRWLQAIRQSANGLIYAWPQYLDIVSPNWQALVAEDYRFVMPLTNRSKWGIRYLYQPAFCQQLGIFGNNVSASIIKAFLDAAQRQYLFAEISLNYQNSFPSNNLYQRKNYLLSLANDYETIRSGYHSNLVKKNLNRVEKYGFTYHTTDSFTSTIQSFQELYARQMSGISSTDYKALATACHLLHASNNAFVKEVRLPGGELLASDIFLKDEKRIYYLLSCTFPNGRSLGANNFLLDQIIREYAGSSLLFDFEGSDVPGIEWFYKKFGPVAQPYYALKWNHLPWPVRLIKK